MLSLHIDRKTDLASYALKEKNQNPDAHTVKCYYCLFQVIEYSDDEEESIAKANKKKER